MEQYISKSAVMAEIEKFIDNNKYLDEYDCGFRDGNNAALYALKEKFDTLEVEEVDLEEVKEKARQDLAAEINAFSERYPEVSFAKVSRIAVRIAKWQKEQDEPTSFDRGMAEEIITHLKRVEEDYTLSLTDEIQWLRNITKKGE